MRTFLLVLATVACLVHAQDRVEFDLDAPDTGVDEAPKVKPWPLSTNIDQVGKALTITWPTGTPVETLSLGDVSHAQRARAFDTAPDELFLVLNDGRRILLCQGDCVGKQVELMRAVVGKDVEQLPMGEGHATRPPGNPPSPKLIVRAGGTGLLVTNVGPLSPVQTEGKPAIKAGGKEATVDGVRRMGKYEIDKHIKARMPHIAKCYQAALTAKPGLTGRVVLGFVITRDGSVGAAKIQSTTLKNLNVERCIRIEILSLKFPPPASNRPVQVSYPFLFSAP
jgi:hypothetical protein